MKNIRSKTYIEATVRIKKKTETELILISRPYQFVLQIIPVIIGLFIGIAFPLSVLGRPLPIILLMTILALLLSSFFIWFGRHYPLTYLIHSNTDSPTLSITGIHLFGRKRLFTNKTVGIPFSQIKSVEHILIPNYGPINHYLQIKTIHKKPILLGFHTDGAAAKTATISLKKWLTCAIAIEKQNNPDTPNRIIPPYHAPDFIKTLFATIQSHMNIAGAALFILILAQNAEEAPNFGLLRLVPLLIVCLITLAFNVVAPLVIIHLVTALWIIFASLSIPLEDQNLTFWAILLMALHGRLYWTYIQTYRENSDHPAFHQRKITAAALLFPLFGCLSATAVGFDLLGIAPGWPFPLDLKIYLALLGIAFCLVPFPTQKQHPLLRNIGVALNAGILLITTFSHLF